MPPEQSGYFCTIYLLVSKAYCTAWGSGNAPKGPKLFEALTARSAVLLGQS